jgi:hypothetical protein
MIGTIDLESWKGGRRIDAHFEDALPAGGGETSLVHQAIVFVPDHEFDMNLFGSLDRRHIEE